MGWELQLHDPLICNPARKVGRNSEGLRGTRRSPMQPSWQAQCLRPPQVEKQPDHHSPTTQASPAPHRSCTGLCSRHKALAARRLQPRQASRQAP